MKKFHFIGTRTSELHLYGENATPTPPYFNSNFGFFVQITGDAYLDPRPEYHRAVLTWQRDDPIPVAVSTGSQCSSRLLSMRSANALLILPPKSDTLKMLPKDSIVDALIIGNL